MALPTDTGPSAAEAAAGPSAHPRLDPAAHHENWRAAAAGDGALYLQRTPAFSPAAAAQDRTNQSRAVWNWGGLYVPWEYTGWWDEQRAAAATCYLGDSSGLGKVRITGPDAAALLSELGATDPATLAVGAMTHYVQTAPSGKVAGQGILFREAERAYLLTGRTSYRVHEIARAGTRAVRTTVCTPETFQFNLQGPAVEAAVSAALGRDVSDLAVNTWADAVLAGVPVRVVRMGLRGLRSSAAGFEIHGPVSHADEIWALLTAAGTPHGLRHLGVRAQTTGHIEVGIATNNYDYLSAPAGHGGADAAGTGGGAAAAAPPTVKPWDRPAIGSHPVDDRAALYRSPFELGWVEQVDLDGHDFVGRDALLAERDGGGPAAALAGLVWDPAGVGAVTGSLFEPDTVLPMELPRYMGMELSHVLLGDTRVGVASSRTYSSRLRSMISLVHLRRDLLVPGTGVDVLWGAADGRRLRIAARVSALPFPS